MDVQLIAVPYDTALRDYRMGAGPERLLKSGLAAELGSDGHRVHLEWVEVSSGSAPAEVRTAFEINRILAEKVRSAVQRGRVPVVLAGNCNTALGTLAGLPPQSCRGILWFDAHGDFNTPESTTGGFLDGMALAMATGRCWTALAATVPGFQSVSERNVLLVGARDFDPLERVQLERSRITILDPERARSGFGTQARGLRARTGGVYVHLDLDVLDPEEGCANSLAVPGGLRLDELRSMLSDAAKLFEVQAVALTAYDPACDPNGKISKVAAALLRVLLAPCHDGSA